MNVHGRVQSSTIITNVWGSADFGGMKCGSKDMYAGLAEGTVYTDKRAKVSVRGQYGPHAKKGGTNLRLPRRGHQKSHSQRRSLCDGQLALRLTMVSGAVPKPGWTFRTTAGRAAGFVSRVLNATTRLNPRWRTIDPAAVRLA